MTRPLTFVSVGVVPPLAVMLRLQWDRTRHMIEQGAYMKIDDRRAAMAEHSDAQSDPPILRRRKAHIRLSNEAHLLARATDRPRWYDGQWNDDFHHPLHILLTGEKDAYYVDYAEAARAWPARMLVKDGDGCWTYDHHPPRVEVPVSMPENVTLTPVPDSGGEIVREVSPPAVGMLEEEGNHADSSAKPPRPGVGGLPPPGSVGVIGQLASEAGTVVQSSARRSSLV